MSASARDANTGMARSFVDEWARAGVTTAALAPGSRSTPLALALAGDARIDLQVFLDERSASFFALGAAKASGRPAVVLTTSGTAAANLHPAVEEACHSRTPLILCTADRPPELRDTGAGQAIDQIKLFGDAVRWFVEVGVPEDGLLAATYWRAVASRSVAVAEGPPAGPVHLNVPFREPLVPAGEPTGVEGRRGGAPWVRTTRTKLILAPEDLDTIATRITSVERGLLTVGWGVALDATTLEQFAAKARWPVLADPISSCRTGLNQISTYDALARDGGFRDAHQPDLVVQLGAPLTSKAATTWLGDSAPRLLVDPDGVWLDPARTATDHVACDADWLLGELALRIPERPPSDWLRSWSEAEAAARTTIDELLDSWTDPFEGRVARDVAATLPDGGTLVVGSSMPVRDLESFARPRSGLRVLSNRGVNGIDGFVSTTLGVARATNPAPVVALLGDLTLLHDAGALLDASRRGLDATLVVLDNAGGGIFQFLPQADLPEHFETVFATPHHVDLVALASVHELPAARVEKATEVAPAVETALEQGGIRLVIVPTDRADNVTRHRQVWEVAAGALRKPS